MNEPKIFRDYILHQGGQQTCKVCGRPDKFDFQVPDNIWCLIVPLEYQTKVVCLACFDDFATAKNIDYSTSLQTIYFAGSKASFKFEVCGDDR